MISVLPASEYYVNANEFNAITLEANIVKAYNVYEAWELSVIDNNNPAWDGFKYNHGISGVQVSGVVLHADINITANDVPDSFFYTSEKEVIYTNTTTGETKVVPAGTKFLIDGRNVYTRLGSDDVVIEGNFFSINAKQFPLVASPAVFGSDANKNYGSDFSNACLFNFRTIENYYDFSTNTFYPCEKNALITVNNLEFIGNAARDNYVDATENLVSGGGLIFFKATNCTKAYMDNIIGNSGFITYFVDYEGSINATNVKCYDSYQNAGYAWGKSEITFTDSYIYGCGGPIIIAQSDKDVPDQHPVITFVNTVTETHVVGNEIWFKAVGADQLMDDIIALSMGLKLPNPNGLGVGSFVDDQGKMNVISAIIASGTDAQTVITGINAQGSVSIDSVEFSRFQTADNLNWAYIKGITEAAMQTGQIPPFFTVTGADGNVYSIYFNGSTFVDLQGAALGTDASHASIIGAFMTAKTITLTQGGLSVTFEFYHN